MHKPRVLIVPGSARQHALSKRLAQAGRAAVERAGGEPTLIDLTDFEMPLYNGDLEARDGLPDAARRLQGLIAEHDSMLFASPEYNGSMTPLLVNALDWCSRFDPGNPTGSGLSIFENKPAALLGSSPGSLGAVRALIHLRDLLGYLGMVVLPQQLIVPNARQAFDEAGALVDETQRKRLDAVAAALVTAGL